MTDWCYCPRCAAPTDCDHRRARCDECGLLVGRGPTDVTVQQRERQDAINEAIRIRASEFVTRIKARRRP